MTGPRQAAERSGRWAEAVAALLLMLKGYRILSRRYRTPFGESDLVARRGRVLAFVEVKLRREFADAAWSIDTAQRHRIVRAAQSFAAKRPDCRDCIMRFDAVLLAPWRLPRHLPASWLAE